MTKQVSRVAATDAEIEAAITRGQLFDQHFTPAIAAEYRAMDDVVAIRLSNGVDIIIPRKLLQGLDQAHPNELNDVSIVGGSGLHWEQLDVDHYVPSLLQGAFGNRQWMSKIGKRGGASRTPAKASAARENGRKGGRPKRTAA